jgi:hypothetical protein
MGHIRVANQRFGKGLANVLDDADDGERWSVGCGGRADATANG